MPTENRSSNTEMVSVPREQLRQFIEYSASVCKSPAWVKDKASLLAALAQPAEQHQGEPVAYRAAGNLFFRRRDAEDRAGSDPVTPLYTRAEAGEVERLRAEIKHLNLLVAQADYNYDSDRANFKRQLAERDALLDRVVDHANFWHDHPYAEVVEVIAKDYKALSENADPSPLVAES